MLVVRNTYRSSNLVSYRSNVHNSTYTRLLHVSSLIGSPITSSPLSSHRNSATSLSANEVIDVNVEELITSKADAREKKWWIDGNYKIIDENRQGVSSKKKYEIANRKVLRVSRWKCSHNRVAKSSAHCALYRQFVRQDPQGRITKGSSKQPDESFVPRLLPKPAQTHGNPWPTIIVEVANSESLSRIMSPILVGVEDVIILKLWKWNSRRDQNETPLRRLTCYKFCRRRSPRNLHGNLQPVQTIEFGTIDGNNQPYNGCTAAGTCTLNISPRCIFFQRLSSSPTIPDRK
ncbi:hypothetical protein RclHR1_07040013 [Rhizophagus clarus]|uniref:Uncharacterized protein n=1 Tax=Rhizophagus clarus TaxID=94130 RepID=A0A2Z6SAR4_9GLOM|nr:hypothetical protein RclHR1_07040013 [Rhizophagus clarus]